MGQRSHACVSSQLMGKEAARAFPIKRNNRGCAAHFAPSLCLPPISEPPLLSSRASLLPPITAVLPPSSAFLLLATAMAPKSTKGKGAAKDAGAVEPSESELAARRAQFALFSSMVDVPMLRGMFKDLWGVKTGGENTGHPTTHVVPASAGASPKWYPFFVDYFSCGLCPPFSDFFKDIMHTYGFHLLDFTPNAVACMALFAHLCEGFVVVHPSTALFHHYFSPRIQKGGAITGSVAWIPRAKGAYPDGATKERWEEWRGQWCWIEEEDPTAFYEVRREASVRGKDWSGVDSNNEKLTIATTRILRLTQAGRTLEMIGADFIRRQIAPPHDKGRPAWLFVNAADIMRLRPGLDNNLVVLRHSHLCQRIFQLEVDDEGEVERSGKLACLQVDSRGSPGTELEFAL